MVKETPHLSACQQDRKRCATKPQAIAPEHLRGGDSDLADAPAPIEDRKADRRQVEQAGVMVARDLQDVARIGKLAPLQLKLHLVRLQLEQQMTGCVIDPSALLQLSDQLIEPAR